MFLIFSYFSTHERTEVDGDRQSHFIGKMIIQIAIIMTVL